MASPQTFTPDGPLVQQRAKQAREILKKAGLATTDAVVTARPVESLGVPGTTAVVTAHKPENAVRARDALANAGWTLGLCGSHVVRAWLAD